MSAKLLKTAAELAMGASSPNVAKTASKTSTSIPLGSAARDPLGSLASSYSKGPKKRVINPRVPHRGQQEITPANPYNIGPGKDPLANALYSNRVSDGTTPFGAKKLDPASSRNKIVGYNESVESAKIELGDRGIAINELLASQKAEREILSKGVDDIGTVEEYNKIERRKAKIAARAEYYSGTNKGADPLKGAYIANQKGAGNNAASDILSPSPYVNDRTTEVADFRFAAEEAEQTGSVVGLLKKQNELFAKQVGFENEKAMHLKAGDYTSAAYADAQALRLGRESELYNDPIKDLERNAKKNLMDMQYNADGVNAPRYDRGQGPTITRDQYLDVVNKKLYSQDAYDEAVHMRNNNATSTNAMNGSANGPTPPSSSNNPINPATTPTGSTNYSGYYQPSQGNTASSVSALNMLNESGGAGIMASIGLGAVLGGSANYAMGGEFGEGAVMGGLAGGAMKIGARAIQANEASIENYLQRTALGDQFTSGMTREQAGRAIQNMNEAPEGLMRGMAYNVLRSEAPSVGMQSRYAVMGGSMLSGVAFTGRRNDKRRGFNAHRGNRI